MLIIAVDPTGRPDRSARIFVRASEGQLAPPIRVSPGIYESFYTVGDDARIFEKVRLSASLSPKKKKSFNLVTWVSLSESEATLTKNKKKKER